MGYMFLFGIKKCWILFVKYPYMLIVNGRRNPLNRFTMEFILKEITCKTKTLLMFDGKMEIDS